MNTMTIQHQAGDKSDATLSLSPGCHIQVLWELEGERIWWKAQVLSCAPTGEIKLRYAAMDEFKEEERTSLLLGEHVLEDVDEHQKMYWRKQGSDYEPEEDPIVTIDDVTQQLDPEVDAMAELGSLGIQQQQQIATSYRDLADKFKSHLRNLLEERGQSHVITSSDIEKIVATIGQNPSV